jgi:hypothetical protein
MVNFIAVIVRRSGATSEARSVPPVGDRLTEIALRDAVGPVLISLAQRRAGQCETGAQVIEDLVGHTDLGGLQRERVRISHGVAPHLVGGSRVVGRWVVVTRRIGLVYPGSQSQPHAGAVRDRASTCYLPEHPPLAAGGRRLALRGMPGAG